jgi:DNA (cytosine-5)-methyltransferase 1
MLLPSPRTSDTNGAGHHGDGGMDLRTAVAEIPLLPTPAAERGGRNKSASEGAAVRWGLDYIDRLLPTPTSRDSHNAGDPERTDARMAERGQPLSEVAVNVLMPTPRATDGTKGGPNQRGSSGDLMLPSAVSSLLPTPMAGDAKMARNSTADRRSEPPTGIHAGDTLGDIAHAVRWGEYEPAIRRHEITFGRPAPEPTKLNAKGNPKLSDEFDEWLMGYPAGWITDVPGVTWNETLKACGNGVVPRQGAAALRFLIAHLARSAA